MQLSLICRAAAGLFVLGSGLASGQTLPASVQSCARIIGDPERLACFDRLAATLRASAAPADAAAPLSPQDKLGLSPARIEKIESSAAAAPAKELKAHIQKISLQGTGLFVFELDNGQTWQQSETKTSFRGRTGDAVVISSTAFGTYWLSTGSHNATKVKRLR